MEFGSKSPRGVLPTNRVGWWAEKARVVHEVCSYAHRVPARTDMSDISEHINLNALKPGKLKLFLENFEV